MHGVWSTPCGPRADHTPDLAASRYSEGLMSLCLTGALESITGSVADRKRKVDTCLCQTPWANAEWELGHAKLVWRKVGQTMHSKTQQSGHFLLSWNYTNIMCLQDLHIFASEAAARSHCYSKSSFSAVPWHICGFASCKQSCKKSEVTASNIKPAQHEIYIFHT